MTEAQYKALCDLERSVDRFVYLNQNTGSALVRRGLATERYYRGAPFHFQITHVGMRALAEERSARAAA